MSFNPTKGTFQTQGNEQAFGVIQNGKFNEGSFPVLLDPLYNSLIQNITKTVIRYNRVNQRYQNVGKTTTENEYSGIMRELMMLQRKGQNYPFDNGVKPTTLGSYDWIDDDIVPRYHSAQFRWMFGYTIVDAMIREFAQGGGYANGGDLLAAITDMKATTATSALNMWIDSVKLKMLNVAQNEVGIVENMTNIDISNFDTLTEADAKAWLNAFDALIYELYEGTSRFNVLNQFQQINMSDMKVYMKRQDYMNVIRRAYPDMYNKETFENIFPANLVLLGQLGADEIVDVDGNPVVPTFDSHGMNELNWDNTKTYANQDPDTQVVIMHNDVLGFEPSLDEIGIAPKDVEKMATPVRAHYWMKCYYTDLLPTVVVKKGA